jgi:ATP-binding cassette, subfamily F, member 3
MISVEGLKVEFNATPLFEDVSYVINKKDRIALVGKNGAGKSTMLKILAGIQQPTSGVVAVPRECTIGYLPQVMVLSDERTVMQEAELAFEHIFEMQADIERMNQQLAERTDYDSEDYQKLIDRFTHENERFLMMGGTNYRAEVERTLQGLGFCREDFVFGYDFIAEVLFKIFTDNKNELTESGLDSIVNRIIHNSFAIRPQSVQLLQATIAAAHAGCQ